MQNIHIHSFEKIEFKVSDQFSTALTFIDLKKKSEFLITFLMCSKIRSMKNARRSVF